MHEYDLHYVFELMLVLVMLAAGVTAAAKKLDQPYPIALVIVGAIIGLVNIPLLEPVENLITEGAVFNFVIVTLFLPALLGEAGIKLPYDQLKENRKPILALAFGGTLLSYLLIGFSLYFFFDFSIPVAFVFAALMSATDPVSVISIFKSVGLKKRLTVIVEGESLFNDGLAVVLFKISAFYLVTYIEAGWLGFGMGLWEFIKVISLGLAVGGAMGYAFSILTKFYDDYPLEIIFSIILFYGSFLLAESIHASGVIAVVTAAIILGNYGASIGMTPTTKLNINNFWDVAALLANSIVFLMIGLEITRIDIADMWPLIGAAIVIVLISRSLAVNFSLFFIKGVPWAWKHIINWGGLKGSLSIALVLSLPREFEGRDELLVLAFSVVLFSLLVQGLTVKPLISYLKIKSSSAGDTEYEQLVAEYERLRSGSQEIQQFKKKLFLGDPILKQLIGEYENSLKKVELEMEMLLSRKPEIMSSQTDKARIRALYAEHEAISRLVSNEIISPDIASKEQEKIIETLITIKKETE